MLTMHGPQSKADLKEEAEQYAIWEAADVKDKKVWFQRDDKKEEQLEMNRKSHI